ncbi:MAG: GNAT family N-acetyltransferase, partial [Flavobacteriaceae bacterium]|nr:GNAT family N-acetyltransferase [Flavobacteriaceae bacterium]
GDYFEEASIGRVVVSKKYRNKEYGKQLMNASVQAVYKFFNQRKIKISAQCYLKNFYNDLGFLEQGESYLEDGIPHITMIKN